MARKRKFYNFLFFASQFSIISEVKKKKRWNAVFLSRAKISNLCGSDGEEKLLGLRYISLNTFINLHSHQLTSAWSTVGFIPAGALWPGVDSRLKIGEKNYISIHVICLHSTFIVCTYYLMYKILHLLPLKIALTLKVHRATPSGKTVSYIVTIEII